MQILESFLLDSRRQTEAPTCQGKAATNLLGIHSRVKLSFPGLLANTRNMFSLSVLPFIAGPAWPPSGGPESFHDSGCVVPLDPWSYGHGSEPEIEARVVLTSSLILSDSRCHLWAGPEPGIPSPGFCVLVVNC